MYIRDPSLFPSFSLFFSLVCDICNYIEYRRYVKSAIYNRILQYSLQKILLIVYFNCIYIYFIFYNYIYIYIILYIIKYQELIDKSLIITLKFKKCYLQIAYTLNKIASPIEKISPIETTINLFYATD